jgi:ankyrin repeat protein
MIRGYGANLFATGAVCDPAASSCLTRAQDGSSAMHHAAEKGYTHIIEKLHDYGLDVNKRDSVGDELHRSAVLGSQVPQEGWTPLLVAAREGHLPAIRTLMGFKADLHAVNEVHT